MTTADDLLGRLAGLDEDALAKVLAHRPDVLREPWPRWLMGPRMVLRTRSLHALEALPDRDGSQAELPITRADRGLASELAAYVDVAVAEHRLRALDPPTSPRALPPG